MDGSFVPLSCARSNNDESWMTVECPDLDDSWQQESLDNRYRLSSF